MSDTVWCQGVFATKVKRFLHSSDHVAAATGMTGAVRKTRVPNSPITDPTLIHGQPSPLIGADETRAPKAQ